MFNSAKIHGLYAITPDEQNTTILCAKVEAALQGGVSMVQYRNKVVLADHRLPQAKALLALCRAYNVPLIINDHLDLCAQIDADGVHLGASDYDLSAARSLLGDDKIIGASCYNQLELAMSAEKAGASYVAFGACFASSTKPNAPVASLDLIKQAKLQLDIPIVAIGGITIENAPQVLAAGADALAVITDIFLKSDIQAMSARYSRLFASFRI
jgi:thiamine-phosphate pyrophosphorylase